MRIWIFFSIIAILGMSSASAHDTQDSNAFNTPIPAAIEGNRVDISEQNGYRVIRSNGIPDHTTGQFPNRNNPNTISPQNHNYRVTMTPNKEGNTTPLGRGAFGVAINGIPFEPGTAEAWKNDINSGWNIEAIGTVNLGLDNNNAHVQPNGNYHYHGIPWGALSYFPHDDGGLLMVGYAADGFPIYMPTSRSGGPKSSYALKSGTRPGGVSGPGGRYNGTYTQDYIFTASSGDLDQCNGMFGKTADYPDGIYHYVLTTIFPYIPRCWAGVPDSSFTHRGAGPPNGGGGRMRDPGRGRPDHPPPHR